jgi:hypothetical protein
MKFHERFNIGMGLEEAREGFVTRVYNEFIIGFVYAMQYPRTRSKYEIAIASSLRKEFKGAGASHLHIGNDLMNSLRAIEAVYSVAETLDRVAIGNITKRILEQSEVDLGIEWRDGEFHRKGAALLDQTLVNDVLHWLRTPGHETVLKPFEKGLKDLLDPQIKKDHLADVVTDMYEAIEALAKIVTERPGKDLSGNREAFISKVQASSEYKELLKNYIEYANRLRHAATDAKPKPVLSEREVESFVYLTGLLIRLAMPTNDK